MEGSIKQPIRFVLRVSDSIAHNPVRVETKYNKKPMKPEKIKIINDRKARIIRDSQV